MGFGLEVFIGFGQGHAGWWCDVHQSEMQFHENFDHSQLDLGLEPFLTVLNDEHDVGVALWVGCCVLRGHCLVRLFL